MQFLNLGLRHSSFPRLSLLPLLTNTLLGPSACEVTTLWHYANLFIVIAVVVVVVPDVVVAIIIIIILFFDFYFLAHQHKACRQLKIKQEMTAVGD